MEEAHLIRTLLAAGIVFFISMVLIGFLKKKMKKNREEEIIKNMLEQAGDNPEKIFTTEKVYILERIRIDKDSPGVYVFQVATGEKMYFDASVYREVGRDKSIENDPPHIATEWNLVSDGSYPLGYRLVKRQVAYFR